MARGYLKWSVQELAKKADVGISTVQRMENVDDVPSASAKNLNAVERALESAGIEFSNDAQGGVGIRVKL